MDRVDKLQTGAHSDAVRGCLIGGAVGDALGYQIEFHSYASIQNEFGKDGITEYKLRDGKALISDDTQMTLFTATGILTKDEETISKGIDANPSYYIGLSYKDWLNTQEHSAPLKNGKYRYSWLASLPEMYNRRAPGNTCLQAISMKKYGSVKEHINNSKGCGGVMRVAPLGIRYEHVDDEKLAMEGAEIAALTHGHSLGYMPAATVTMILNRIVFHKDEYKSLKEIVVEAKEITDRVFCGDKHLHELDSLIDMAIELSANDKTDYENIKSIGEGWVAEETLAIAIYCAIKYQDDFDKAVIAAVNHDGDSDSTGAVLGNIVGAWGGYDRIDEKWKRNLELSDIILEISDSLCRNMK